MIQNMCSNGLLFSSRTPMLFEDAIAALRYPEQKCSQFLLQSMPHYYASTNSSEKILPNYVESFFRIARAIASCNHWFRVCTVPFCNLRIAAALSVKKNAVKIGTRCNGNILIFKGDYCWTL